MFNFYILFFNQIIMKKLFFFAVAALTLAACSKNEVFEPVDNTAISFQAVNYLSQTKTDLPSAVKFEDYTSFTTDAWFHPADGGSAQVFMSGETVSLKPDVAEWSPARTYFWPKTGYINFFSQAGAPVATIADATGTTAQTAATATYGSSSSPVAIDTTDNAVLASAAYRYSRANWETNTYTTITYGSTGHETDVKGVPTLFHHMLAKVRFVVKFDASAGSAKDKWVLQINNAHLHYANNGYTVVSMTDPGSTGLAWPWTANEQVGWTATAGDANLAAPGLPKSQEQAGVDGSTASVNNGRVLFGDVSVLPQDLTAATGTGAKLSLNYTLTHYYDTQDYTANPSGPAIWTSQISETVNLYDDDAVDNSNPALGAIALTDFTSSDYDNWYMNHKYVYTVTIKPDHKITFSPAVIPWVTSNNTGYTYPEN